MRLPAYLKHCLYAAAALLIAGAAARADDWAGVEAAAKAEKELTVYVGINSSLTEAIAKDFEARYGIQVNILTGRAPEIRERLRTEAASNSHIADICYTGNTTGQSMAADYFQPHGEFPNLAKISADFAPLMSEGKLVPAQISSFGILANTQMVKPEEMPKKWTDLLDPKWKGKILMDDPRTNGGGNIFTGVTLKTLGRAFHEKLAQQDPVMSRGYAESERRVARGEFAFFIPDTMTSYAKLRGLPVRLILPEEGNPYIVSTLSLVNKAPHPNAARLFINYFFEKESLAKFGGLGFAGPVPGMADKADADIRPYLTPKLMGTLHSAELAGVIAEAKEIYGQ